MLSLRPQSEHSEFTGLRAPVASSALGSDQSARGAESHGASDGNFNGLSSMPTLHAWNEHLPVDLPGPFLQLLVHGEPFKVGPSEGVLDRQRALSGGPSFRPKGWALTSALSQEVRNNSRDHQHGDDHDLQEGVPAREAL